MNFEAEGDCARVRARAERRAGELIKEQKRAGQLRTAKEAGPGRGKKKGVALADTFSKKTLSDYGITYRQSSKWQELAEIPSSEFLLGIKIRPAYLQTVQEQRMQSTIAALET